MRNGTTVSEECVSGISLDISIPAMYEDVPMHMFAAIDYACLNLAIGRLATGLAEAQSTKPEATLLGGIAELISALAWPTLVAVLLITQRRPLEKMIGAIVSLAESANKIKIWLLEVERQITQEVNQSEMLAQTAPTDPKSVIAPSTQADAAKRVGKLIDIIPTSAAKDKVLQSVKENVEAFAADYDGIRASMPAGVQRTVAMNGVAAKMRTQLQQSHF